MCEEYVQLLKAPPFRLWEPEPRPDGDEDEESSRDVGCLSLEIGFCWVEEVWPGDGVDDADYVVGVPGEGEGLRGMSEGTERRSGGRGTDLLTELGGSHFTAYGVRIG